MQSISKYTMVPMLTERELEIIELIIYEFSTREIAQKLNLSFETVKTYRSRIMSKLQVRNVAGIVREAIQKRIVLLQSDIRIA